MGYLNHFGAQVKAHHKASYAQSPHWDGKKFTNLEETSLNINWQTLPELLRKQFCEKVNREPKKPLPIKPFHKSEFLSQSNQARFIWYGHSVVLMRMNNRTLLIDPMFGRNASPIAPFETKRFSANTLALIDDFPVIDLVILSHDHYDHLDLDSIKKIASKAKQYYTALGVGRHLERWGIPSDRITEFDWWQSQDFQDISVTFTPTRHFSGRGLTDRAQSLWGGWVLKTGAESIYFSGDGGYGAHFKDVGERLGPFDFGMMECGQYNENWHQIHMYPEESVQAAIDARVQKAMPVHWGAFALAQHPWTEPVVRFVDEAKKQNLSCLHPAIGEPFSYLENEELRWWETIE